MRHIENQRRRGFSMMEVVVSTTLVGLVVIGGMNAIGGVIKGRQRVGDDGKAEHLARQLMAEIVEKAYNEPTDAPLFGREIGESSTFRTAWDDVDDYHNWSASPPVDRNGSALSGMENWKREVVVEWVAPTDPSKTVGSDQGVKRITVTVQKKGRVLMKMVSLRCNRAGGK